MQFCRRCFSSQVLHKQPIPFQWVSIQDVDRIPRKLRYYDSEICPPSPSSQQLPVVILCGTAQSIQTWSSHLRYFSSLTRFVIPELRCQGSTELLSSSSSLSQHVEDLYQFLQLKELKKINLIGFSLGGRVGLAFASRYPDYVNKLSITGVPLTRPPLGHLILQSWKEGLDQKNYHATAWSCILNGFSTNFLIKNSKMVPTLVNNVLENNNMENLRDLLTNTLIDTSSSSMNKSSPSHQQYLERYLKQLSCPIQVICGQEDRIAGSGSEKELASMVPFGCYVEIPDCGHLVPFEKPVVWRKTIVDFMMK
jgi:pimeloyl-ACP methyl ester carboxylesterase